MATMREKEQALEAGLVQTVFRPCAEFLIDHAALGAGQRLLDVGCGSGIVSRVALEREPRLQAACGFDRAGAAVEVACMAAAAHPGKNKLAFWAGDAGQPRAYRGLWDVCTSQHVVQHAPGMLAVLRQALAPGGCAIIATWPEPSTRCSAYRFLHAAALEGNEAIGMPMEALRQRAVDAGFSIVREVAAEIRTPRVCPAAFLRQYLEGKHLRPTNIDELVGGAHVDGLARQNAAVIHPNGDMEFAIALHVVIAA